MFTHLGMLSPKTWLVLTAEAVLFDWFPPSRDAAAAAQKDPNDAKKRRVSLNQSKTSKSALIEPTSRTILTMGVPEVEQDAADGGGGVRARREVRVFDDIAWVLFGPVDSVPKSELDMAALRDAASAMLEFVFYQSCVYKGTEHSKYSSLRSAIISHIVETHIEQLKK